MDLIVLVKFFRFSWKIWVELFEEWNKVSGIKLTVIIYLPSSVFANTMLVKSS